MRLAVIAILYACAGFLWVGPAGMSWASIVALMVFFTAHNLEKHWLR